MSEPTKSSFLGHYQIIRLLDEGGMGKVYLAEDHRLQRQVAIKQLHNNKLSKLGLCLRREATSLARLNHPNIVQIYDVVEESESLAIVMEYAPGSNLKDYLRDHCVNLRQRLQWLQEIADGLQAAHDKGLIHRDLKAENILISASGQAKITDFGIVKIKQDDVTEYSQSDRLVGSYSALSPEQALNMPLGTRSDLFSLGVLGFRLVCGTHPFGRTDNPMALVQNILHQPPLDISTLNPDVPPELKKLLLSMLSKNPECRPPNAISVRNQLQDIIRQLPLDAPQDTCDETAPIALDHAASNASLSNYGIAHTYSQDVVDRNRNNLKVFSHRFTRSILIAVLLVVGISVTAYWRMETPAPPLYVAVLAPSIEYDKTVVGQQELLVEMIRTTIEQSILDTKGLHLISPQQVQNQVVSTDDYQINAARLGADVIVETSLTCEPQRCQIQLRRMQASTDTLTTKNKEANRPWEVKQQFKWPVVIDKEYKNLVYDLLKKVEAAFPLYQHSNKKMTVLNNKDYEYFIGLRLDVRNGQYSQKAWRSLLKKRNDFAEYPAYYDLMDKLARHLYDDTQDPRYLDQLQRLIEQATRLIGPDLVLSHSQINIALRQQNFKKVEELITVMEGQGADTQTLFIQKARLAQFEGDYNKADSLLQRALALRPSVELWYNLAFNHWSMGDGLRARAALNQIFKLNSNDYDASMLMGAIALLSGDFTMAVNQYKQLLKLNPNAAMFYNNLGLAYEFMGDLVKAQEAFFAAVKLTPENATHRLNLADSYNLLGRTQEANKQYLKTLELSKQLPTSWESLVLDAQAYIHLGETAKAIKALHQSMHQAVDNPEVLFAATLVYAKAEQFATSLDYVEQSINKGIDASWFSLPYHDGLCQDFAIEFNTLVSADGASLRCQ